MVGASAAEGRSSRKQPIQYTHRPKNQQGAGRGVFAISFRSSTVKENRCAAVGPAPSINQLMGHPPLSHHYMSAAIGASR
jgi:hypothetical protein